MSTIDGKLVQSINSDKALEFKILNKEDFNRLRNKAKTLSLDIKEYENNELIQLTTDEKITIYGIDNIIAINTFAKFKYAKFKSINLTNLDTSKVNDMSHMFFNCETKEIDISKLDTSNVENMSYMFHGYKTTKLNLNVLNTKNVKIMNCMFRRCEIDELDLSSINTDKLESAIYMFANCKIEKLNIKSLNSESIKNLHNIFFLSKIKNLIASDNMLKLARENINLINF